MSALTSWSPGDYKRAGDKHYETCKQLLSNNIKQDQQLQSILFDIYYLSGYVIECLLKYYILIVKHNYKINNKITKETLDRLGLKDHNIKNLSTIANERGGKDIKFAKKSSLFKNWSEQIRYGLKSSVELTKKDIITYFDEISEVRNELKKI